MIELSTRTTEPEVSQAALKLRKIKPLVSQAAEVYERRYPYEKHLSTYPEEADAANGALPQVGGAVLLIAADIFGIKVIDSGDNNANMLPNLIDRLEVQSGRETAMPVYDLAVRMVSDMEDISSGFKATLTEYVNVTLERRCQRKVA